jgi:hypothetical protein
MLHQNITGGWLFDFSHRAKLDKTRLSSVILLMGLLLQ